jgi:hypothetical protein
MSEDATRSTPDADTADPAGEAPADAAAYEGGAPAAAAEGRGSNVRLIVLVGALMLLGGTLLGSRLGTRLPLIGGAGGDAANPQQDPAAQPGGGGGPQVPIPPGELPAYLHYLNICEFVENDGRRINMYNVVAQLRPAKLPSPGTLTVVAAVSANSPDRRIRIQGIAPGGATFLDEELSIDPVDPTRPFVNFFKASVNLTSPEPLMFQLIADDIVLARRLLHVRPRDMDPPTTGPAPTTTTTTAPAPGPAAPQ